MLENIGIVVSHEEVSSIMRYFDVDLDSKLSYKEFVKRLKRYGLRGRAVEYNILKNFAQGIERTGLTYEEVFRIMDWNQNGEISAEELK